MEQSQFSFKRSRGIVWVCDIRGSSKLLNDDSTAAALEEFLPRLHWIGRTVVNLIGGTFIKWTGDGFLSWIDVPLHRDLPRVVGTLLDAIWHLTFTLNVTQLAVDSKVKIQIRHGLSFEHDALITTMLDRDNHSSVDVTGRGVVLAFRLSSLPAKFPGIAVDAAIAQATKESGNKHVHLKPWKSNKEDMLRFFKGETWGLKGVAVTCDKGRRVRCLKAILKDAEGIIAKSESKSVDADSFVPRYTAALAQGPDWAQQSLDKEFLFIKDQLFGPLKTVTDQLRGAMKKGASGVGTEPKLKAKQRRLTS